MNNFDPNGFDLRAGLFNLFAPRLAIGESFGYASGHRPPLQVFEGGTRCYVQELSYFSSFCSFL